eukprot:6211508-Pleurochrysis_carterae.AAC.2
MKARSQKVQSACRSCVDSSRKHVPVACVALALRRASKRGMCTPRYAFVNGAAREICVPAYRAVRRH